MRTIGPQTAAILVAGLLYWAPFPQAAAQGPDDLAGFWCEARYLDTAGNCISKHPWEDLDMRWQATMRGELIFFEDYGIRFWKRVGKGPPRTFRGVVDRSSLTMRGEIEGGRSLTAPHDFCKVFYSFTGTISSNRKAITITWRGPESYDCTQIQPCCRPEGFRDQQMTLIRMP